MPAKSTQPIAVVTGANRGIGYEICRQLAGRGYHVILAARDVEKGRLSAERLRSELGSKGRVDAAHLDVSDAESIREFSRFLTSEYGKLDVLVNNAGVLLDPDEVRGGGSAGSSLNIGVDTIRRTMETNVYGPFQLLQAFSGLLGKSGHGRVVNISSGMGQLSEMNGGYPAYRISKTALNAVTRIFSEELRPSGVLVNSVCPGWVKTEMGGTGADREVSEGADTPVWLATLPDDGPTGGFFRDREKIEW
jgi:NAD(P)-dependent dehydrogenase (short-subunit alcohol dehydrogenase family)